MEITDNGIGIQGALPAEGRVGLRGLSERARLAGGWLDVCPNPSSGTSLLLSLPVVDPTNDFVIADDETIALGPDTLSLQSQQEVAE